MKKLFILIAVVGLVAFSVNGASAGTRSVGINAGWVSPQDMDGTWTIGASLDLGIPMANMYVSPYVSYWNRSETTPAVGTLIPAMDVSFRDIEFGGTIKYVIPTAAPKVQPFIGAGIGAHMYSAEVLGISASETKVGYHFGGGLQIGATERMNIVGQGWYTLVDQLDQWSVRGGVAWNI